MRKPWETWAWTWASSVTSEICSGNHATLSLPKQHRLQRDSDVQAVFDDGTFYNGTYCHLIEKPNPDNPLRATVIISQKTAQLATDRNRIKRILRESLRLEIDQLVDGHDLVLLATRKAHGDLKRQDIDRDLHPLLKKAGLYRSDQPSPDHPTGIFHRFLNQLISLYQDYVSPLLGRHCRFHPTCSEYTKQALAKHGIVKGLFLGGKRIIRCNPLSKGGHDPVP